MSVNFSGGKIHTFKGECAHFSVNKFPIYTHDGASAKFSTNSQETDYSVCSGGQGSLDGRQLAHRINI
jgi:hypothetical protein